MVHAGDLALSMDQTDAPDGMHEEHDSVCLRVAESCASSKAFRGAKSIQSAL